MNQLNWRDNMTTEAAKLEQEIRALRLRQNMMLDARCDACGGHGFVESFDGEDECVECDGSGHDEELADDAWALDDEIERISDRLKIVR